MLTCIFCRGFYYCFMRILLLALFFNNYMFYRFCYPDGPPQFFHYFFYDSFISFPLEYTYFPFSCSLSTVFVALTSIVSKLLLPSKESCFLLFEQHKNIQSVYVEAPHFFQFYGPVAKTPIISTQC